MKLQSKDVFYILAIVVLVMFVFTQRGINTNKIQEIENSNKRYQDSLRLERSKITDARAELARERLLSQGIIEQKQVEIDSIVDARAASEKRLRQELFKLKSKSLKELENEAERMYIDFNAGDTVR